MYILFSCHLYAISENIVFLKYALSLDVTSGIDKTPCIKIDRPLVTVVYRFGNLMTSIIMDEKKMAKS